MIHSLILPSDTLTAIVKRIGVLLKDDPTLLTGEVLKRIEAEFTMSEFDKFFVEGLIHGAKKCERL